MPNPRLVLFLSDVEGNLTALRQSLRRVCEELGLPTPEVKWAQAPAGLTDAGWHVAEVPLAPRPQGQGGQLEEHLDKVTQALAQDFRDRAIEPVRGSGQQLRAGVRERPGQALEGAGG